VRALAAAGLVLGLVTAASLRRPSLAWGQVPNVLNVSLSASPQTAATGQVVTFTYSANTQSALRIFSSIAGATITFGDGTSTSLGGGGGGSGTLSGTTTHVYSSGGAYTATLTATDSLGNTSSNSATVQVGSNQAPSVNVSVSPATAAVGQPVSVSYSASAGLGIGFPTISNALISYGDGSAPLPLNSPSGNVSYTYSSPGVYTITVSATSGGFLGTGTATVNVSPGLAGPVVTLSASPQQVPAGQTVNFVGTVLSASPGAITTAATIFFGDGQSQAPMATGAGLIAQHPYASPGTYVATLNVSDSSGQTGQATTSISVTQPSVSGQPPAGVQIVSAPPTGSVGQTIPFSAANATAQNTGATIASYSWSWGDGSSNIGQNTNHLYSSPGTYAVTLTVTDSSGANGTASSSITISPLLPQGITVNLPAGWNLVGGPSGSVIVNNSGPLYSFQAGDTIYRTIDSSSPLTAGTGYWANFPTGGTITLPTTNPQIVTAVLPAGQYVMIGNPGDVAASVTGADVIFAFDPVANSYVQTTTLTPGQGGWAISDAGGTATISNAR